MGSCNCTIHPFDSFALIILLALSIGLSYVSNIASFIFSVLGLFYFFWIIAREDDYWFNQVPKTFVEARELSFERFKKLSPDQVRQEVQYRMDRYKESFDQALSFFTITRSDYNYLVSRSTQLTDSSTSKSSLISPTSPSRATLYV